MMMVMKEPDIVTVLLTYSHANGSIWSVEKTRVHVCCNHLICAIILSYICHVLHNHNFRNPLIIATNGRHPIQGW